VCGSPRLCRRRERCLIKARFGRWPLAWRQIWAISMFDLAVQFVALYVGNQENVAQQQKSGGDLCST